VGNWSTLKDHKANKWLFFNQLLNQHNLCELCLQPSGQNLFLCPACYQDLPFNNIACSQCAEPLNTTSDTPLRCGRCQASPPAYDYTIGQFLYRPAISIWIQKMKDKRQLLWGHQLARLMLQSPPAVVSQIDALTYIPSSGWRLFRRGFNPAGLLAEQLARQLNIPLLHHALHKSSQHDQRRLNRSQRQKNQQRGLQPGQLKLNGQHILIIDDVMTTGATLNAAAQALKQQGAAMVGGWILARTPAPDFRF